MSTDNNLWMGDIKPWMNESFILNSFNYYNIYPLFVKLIHDKVTNELRNFCFINFKSIEEANKCLIMLNGKQIPNTQLKFKLNWANYFSTFNKSVYVGNLSPDVDDISLYKLFKEKYSSVHHASVMIDKGKSKGFGFILFRDQKEYERCLNEMNGILFHGNIIKVKEQIKKDEEIKKNTIENNENLIHNIDNKFNNINENLVHYINNDIYKNKNNNKQNSLNIFYNLNNKNVVYSNYNALIANNNINNNNNININNIDNNVNYNSINRNIINNNNNLNIINNIIKIHNINNINNINIGNDINNLYTNKKLLLKNIMNKNNMNDSLNNINNNLNISGQNSLYIKNNIILNNNNSIFLNNNQTINNNNNHTKPEIKISKNTFIPKYEFEIFNNYDNNILKQKINENLDKMYKYYSKIYDGDIKNLRCKNNIFNLYNIIYYYNYSFKYVYLLLSFKKTIRIIL